jgi:uncharacterized protein DUF5658
MMGLLRRSPPLLFVGCIALGAAAMGAQAPADPPPPSSLHDPQPAVPAAAAEPPRALMVSLFAGFIAAQALDVHSTLRGLDAGGREANGAMRWATGDPATFITLKAATTTATCLIVDRVRRSHPRGAMFLLVGIDAAYAAVVAHNYLSTGRSPLAAGR